MSWKEEQKEKALEVLSLLITVILDLGLIIVSTYLLEQSKTILESIIGTSIDKAENWTFKIIYTISKFIIIAGFVLYAIDDILSHLISKYKKFKK